MLVHGIDPMPFLDYVHDIDHGALAPAPRLAAALAALPGRRLIFTNGTTRHAASVLDRLGLGALFDGIFDIQAADFLPKPYIESYAKLIHEYGVDPFQAAMFEDVPRNLLPAAQSGMTTVWVRENGVSRWAPAQDADTGHIDHVTDDLAGWLEGAVA